MWKKYSLTFATFSNGVNYVSHAGEIGDKENLSELKGIYSFLKNLDAENSKKILLPPPPDEERYNNNSHANVKKSLEQHFFQGIYSYFPASRTESPFWLNQESLINIRDRFSFEERIVGENEKNILCETVFEDNIKWLFNVLVDSNVSIENTHRGSVISDMFASAKLNNKKMIDLIERIFSIIFSRKVRFITGLRYYNAQRLQIFDIDKNCLLIDNLAKLSLGQKILLNIFLTMVRYGDNDKFSETNNLRGIVIIDEIDSHLHIELQKNVLPQLISLFPQVQFIITTHSPFFVMGMAESGKEFEIMELPHGRIIQHSEFSEIHEATKIFFPTYEQAYSQVSKLKEQIAKINKPLILTEGRSDEIILKNAWQKIYFDKDMPFDIIPCGYDVDISKRNGGAKELNNVLVRVSECNFSNKIIGLFDNDQEGNGQFNGLQSSMFERCTSPCITRKHLKNYIWGMLLPVPEFRKEKYEGTAPSQRRFSIEHYFPDELLKENNMLGDEVVPGSQVYEIAGDKVSFANKTSSFDVKEFDNFKILFGKLFEILHIDILAPKIELLDTNNGLTITIHSNFQDESKNL